MNTKKLVFLPDGAGGYVFAGTLIGPAVRKMGQPAMLKITYLGEERIVPSKGAKIVQNPDEL